MMRLDFWYFDSDLQTVSAGLKITRKNHKYSHPGAQCSLRLGTILYSSPLMDKYRLSKHYELVQLLFDLAGDLLQSGVCFSGVGPILEPAFMKSRTNPFFCSRESINI